MTAADEPRTPPEDDTGQDGGQAPDAAPGGAASAAEAAEDAASAEKDTAAENSEAQADAAQESAGGLGAELETLRKELDERTRDLQRVSAEYANYRKRVERDKAHASDEATASVLRALLPVLDDFDRARAHGDLTEGVATIVDQLVAAVGKFGLTPVGEPGDAFDPNHHEAVAHRTSPDVTGPTCVEVLRRGYLLGDRLLRPAMVAVADPGEEPESARETSAGEEAVAAAGGGAATQAEHTGAEQTGAEQTGAERTGTEDAEAETAEAQASAAAGGSPAAGGGAAAAGGGDDAGEGADTGEGAPSTDGAADG